MTPNDPVVLLAAFLLGFLVGRIPATSWWSKLRYEIRQIRPRRCQGCGKWKVSYSIRADYLDSYGWILLCWDCHSSFFSPKDDERELKES